MTQATRKTPRDVFSRASLKLATLFAAIVVLLIAASGYIMYHSFSTDIQNAIHSQPSRGSEQEYVRGWVTHFRWQLIAIDGVIILIVGAAGFLYARRTLRPIRENSRAQQRFIADASHELRTPLAIMRADFEVALRGGALDETAKPVLESGLEEVGHMTGIVDDLLMLSRIDAHQEELRPTQLDLVQLVRHTVDKLRTMAAANGVALPATTPGGRLGVLGDASHLERALLNLVKNAIEASDEGDAVDVSLRRANRTVEIAVTDQGRGMTPEELMRAFDRFYRPDASRSRESGGSGLGLSIAHWVARQHGGDIVGVSSLGKGTQMTISLPALDPPS
jgi:signal transduction histidine kinase